MRHPVNAAVRRKWNSCHLGTDHTLLKSEKGVISAQNFVSLQGMIDENYVNQGTVRVSFSPLLT